MLNIIILWQLIKKEKYLHGVVMNLEDLDKIIL